jgi:hypothetical protein
MNPAQARLPILQALVTRDPIAGIACTDRSRRNLPARIVIAGGKHHDPSQRQESAT